ncbi:TolB protein [Myxococcus fulvus]|uniref:TolB protein n=1 Tax=Myxococcus fulvus TaxID=33 RepID=A0A511TCT9_MYXFU|nr:hypothetical protein [Myxococcus fulvus]GEN11996.1 hypothetical protein MFU01_70330 [Myxococcus fulvus]SEU39055.1 TolB protein [Myxococcus fulvus]
MKTLGMAVAGLLLSGSVAHAEEGAASREVTRVRAMRAAVEPMLAKEFGAKAFVATLHGRGAQTVLGVIEEAPPPGTDLQPRLAVLRYDEARGTVRVVDRAFKYAEASALGDKTLLLTPEGDLRLREGSGRERLLAQRVLGDLAPSVKGDGVVATLSRTGAESHETAVGFVGVDGRVTVVADGPGLDAMGSVSPDGRTVVFVSGRTTMASWFRTTLDGAEPVQLTNVGLKAGALRDGVPANFVPPPINTGAMEWLSEDRLRYAAGGGELWTLDVRTGVAVREGGAR